MTTTPKLDELFEIFDTLNKPEEDPEKTIVVDLHHDNLEHVTKIIDNVITFQGIREKSTTAASAPPAVTPPSPQLPPTPPRYPYNTTPVKAPKPASA